jgi:hypothetical protein
MMTRNETNDGITDSNGGAQVEDKMTRRGDHCARCMMTERLEVCENVGG